MWEKSELLKKLADAGRKIDRGFSVT